jgi:hypothetical protein
MISRMSKRMKKQNIEQLIHKLSEKILFMKVKIGGELVNKYDLTRQGKY